MINRKDPEEKIAIKDVKLRTFITEDTSRNEMVQHVYDITMVPCANMKIHWWSLMIPLLVVPPLKKVLFVCWQG